MKVRIQVIPLIDKSSGRICDFCGQEKRVCNSFVGRNIDICASCARAAIKALTPGAKIKRL